MSITLTSRVTRSEDDNGTRVFHACESALAANLKMLLRQAELQGFVITVDLVPNEPLAMGNYRMVGHVRPAR
jgi:hypothetical protein